MSFSLGTLLSTGINDCKKPVFIKSHHRQFVKSETCRTSSNTKKNYCYRDKIIKQIYICSIFLRKMDGIHQFLTICLAPIYFGPQYELVMLSIDTP